MPVLAERPVRPPRAHRTGTGNRGDFYDFFPVNDNRLCFVIADVSGKGMPDGPFHGHFHDPAEGTAREGLPPEKILSRVNDELSRNNDVNMFVTVFCGI